MSRRRAAVAALLSLLAPGLGHVYLREWIRAISWFLIAVATVAVLLPESAYEAAQSGGFETALRVSRTLPQQVYLAAFAIRTLNALDAAILGFRGEAPGGGGGDRCPECGGELESDLDFCPWCTTRLEDRS